MRRRLLIGLALLLSSPATALEAPPPIGPARDFALPAVESYTLGNGLKVTLIPYGSVPKLTAVLRIRAGRLDEGPRGLTDLVAGLMNEGAGGRSPAELARAAGDIGGSVGVGNNADSFTISVDALSDFTSQAFALLADVARRPDLPAAELPRLKQDALRALAVADQDPQTQAARAFARAYYGAHPYGDAQPLPETIKAITPDQIAAFIRGQFGAARSDLYVAGRFDAVQVKAAIDTAFGDWPAGPPPTINPPRPNEKLTVRLVDRPGAPQSTIYLGIPVADAASPDRIALGVTDEVLSGGGLSSRITQNLREKHGWAYSPGSSVSFHPGVGTWLLTADVTAENSGDAVREILAEIGRLRAEPPTADELGRIKNNLAGLWVLRSASRAGLIGTLAFYDLYGLPRADIGRYTSRVRAVAPAEVRALAARYLRPEAATLVIVGDRAKLLEQLKSLPALAAALVDAGSPR